MHLPCHVVIIERPPSCIPNPIFSIITHPSLNNNISLLLTHQCFQNDTLLHATRDPPCNDDVATICTECMSCTAKDSGIAIEYFVHTGWEIDYDRCQRVLDCMNEDHFANSITHWHCEADCRSGTYLHFNSIFHQQGRINWCFDDTWPEIEGDRDAFNCPSH